MSDEAGPAAPRPESVGGGCSICLEPIDDPTRPSSCTHVFCRVRTLLTSPDFVRILLGCKYPFKYPPSPPTNLTPPRRTLDGAHYAGPFCGPFVHHLYTHLLDSLARSLSLSLNSLVWDSQSCIFEPLPQPLHS
jgi:hypothetical protein